MGALAATLTTASAHDQQVDSFFGTDVGINVQHDLFTGFVFNHSHDGNNDYVVLDRTSPPDHWIALNNLCSGVWRGWGSWFRASQRLKALCVSSSAVTTGGASAIWWN